jgi:uncharacterized protein YgbK (DUF1537 family)
MAAPLLTFYGDDFTGSSAVMEVLAFAGIPTAMFLDVPSPALLARLGHIRAFGIAGVARSQNPAWMDANLPHVFRALHGLGAPLLHYKTCSTFDSAPHLGSIGKAIELGLATTGSDWTPLVVGAPAIGRYQIFGTLFAALQGAVHRLDRHPVMARHPATPMTEADLCRHLATQTSLASAVIDWRALNAGRGDAEIAAAREAGAKILALDVFDEATLAETGRLIWDAAETAPLFATGSQGVEYALVAHWRQIGVLLASVPLPALKPAAPLVVVSGSCSSVTARQIAAAEAGGFAGIALDATAAIDEARWVTALDTATAAMLATLGEGRSALVQTARGPDDPAIPALNEAIATSGADAAIVHARIGAGLGEIVRRARLTAGITRAIFSGGDTSGHAMLALGAEALLPVCPLADGVPLLEIRSAESAFDGLEIALKGGQMGADSLFIRARDGG